MNRPFLRSLPRSDGTGQSLVYDLRHAHDRTERAVSPDHVLDQGVTLPLGRSELALEQAQVTLDVVERDRQLVLTATERYPPRGLTRERLTEQRPEVEDRNQ